MSNAIKIVLGSHVVDILGSTTGRDQPIMLVEKALELVGSFDEEHFLDENTVFFDPFCKAGEVLMAAAIKTCFVKHRREKPIATVSEITSELYGGRFYALSPDKRHYLLSRRTFYGNDKSHEGDFTTHIREGSYLSETDGRLDKEIFVRELKSMLEFIKSSKPTAKIVAIGNPPYQENYDGDGSNTGANPIYHLFLSAIMESKLVDQFVMVIPSRWFAGGRGKSLKDFAQKLRKSQQVKAICDFENSKDVFPTVDIKGGVCFLHWSSTHKGKALFFNKNTDESELVDLAEGDIIARDKTSRSILSKVKAKSPKFVSDIAWSWNPFDLASNYFENNAECKGENLLECFTKRQIIKNIKKSKITKNREKIETYKVTCPKAVSSGGIPYRTDQIFIMNKTQICTETYMILDSFPSLNEAKRFLSYLQTDFARYLLSIKKITQDITKETWMLVPLMDSSEVWTDQKLNKHFNLDKNELEHIKSKVQEWA